MTSPSTVVLRRGAVEDRWTVRGTFLQLERWSVSPDPRSDELECRQVLARLQLERARDYARALACAIEEAETEGTLQSLVPERPR